MIETLQQIILDMQTRFQEQGWTSVFGLAKSVTNQETDAVSVVVPLQGNELADVTITDHRGNYVYLRALSSTAAYTDEPRLGCNTQKAMFDLRAVAVWADNSIKDAALFDKLLADLKSYDRRNQFKQSHKLQIRPIRGYFDGAQVYTTETNLIQQQRNLAIAAVDLSLEFIITNCNTQSEKCPVNAATIPCN